VKAGRGRFVPLAAGSTFFENRSRRRSRKHQSNKAAGAGVRFKEAFEQGKAV
jgi:hypothetical protein